MKIRRKKEEEEHKEEEEEEKKNQLDSPRGATLSNVSYAHSDEKLSSVGTAV